MVIGSLLTPALPSSAKPFVALLGGMLPGYLDMYFHIVTVKDAAEAHVQAALLPGIKPGSRFLLSAGEVHMRDIAMSLHKEFGSQVSHAC